MPDFRLIGISWVLIIFPLAHPNRKFVHHTISVLYLKFSPTIACLPHISYPSSQCNNNDKCIITQCVPAATSRPDSHHDIPDNWHLAPRFHVNGSCLLHTSLPMQFQLTPCPSVPRTYTISLLYTQFLFRFAIYLLQIGLPNVTFTTFRFTTTWSLTVSLPGQYSLSGKREKCFRHSSVCKILWFFKIQFSFLSSSFLR